MKLYSKIIGDNLQDLIIIHGLFGMSDNWITLARKFATFFKVHLIDLRNHGKSPHSGSFDYNVINDDILEYITDNHILNPIILGHSLGGKVAMKFAFTYPERTKKIIVADIAPRQYDTSFHKKLLSDLIKLDLKNFKSRNDVDKELEIYIKNTSVRLFLLKNLYRNDKKEFAWKFNIEVLLDKLKNIEDASFISGVCKVPSLFIRGGDSDYINDNDAILLKKHFSDFSIKTIDKAGHWLHAEQPQVFYNEVIRFNSELNIS